MTDFDKKAREIACDPHLDAVIPVIRDELEKVIAAALKAAYNEGLENAADHMYSGGYGYGPSPIRAGAIRAKKLST